MAWVVVYCIQLKSKVDRGWFQNSFTLCMQCLSHLNFRRSVQRVCVTWFLASFCGQVYTGKAYKCGQFFLVQICCQVFCALLCKFVPSLISLDFIYFLNTFASSMLELLNQYIIIIVIIILYSFLMYVKKPVCGFVSQWIKFLLLCKL